ncbi:hypothetical protein [Sporomusa sp. GT1]|uniref:hypothetical protein n=1 Tax=Sporomusa sp. GT1 TaxID=1534747 RepID=UPI001668F559|nr:hypothetical protein [Sporomusa sp. GT1]
MEELLKQILFEIKGLKDGQTAMQSDITAMRGDIKGLKDGQVAIQAEIKNIKEADAAILDMLEKTYRKVEEVETNQDRMGESIRYLMRQGVQHDEDINRIRKAL